MCPPCEENNDGSGTDHKTKTRKGTDPGGDLEFLGERALALRGLELEIDWEATVAARHHFHRNVGAGIGR